MEQKLEWIIEKVESLPIEEVIGGEIDLHGMGRERDAICPFHNDRKLGNFKVNTQKGLWRCFACGEGGKGGISFYQKYHNVSFHTAVQEIGLRHHVITQEESEYLLKNTPSNDEVRELKTKRVVQKQEANQKLPPDELDQVYRLFISCCAPMTQSFQQSLMETRHLEEGDLKYFFAMPRCTPVFMGEFYRKLREQGLDKSVLEHTPGFYFDTINQVYRFVDPGINALGIIAYDDQGRINGIQIRRETDDKKKRYIWFSSGFADGRNENCVKGSVNSGVVDVVPGTRKSVMVCTEGKFKALKINKMGFTALNMHGVTSWPAEKVIEYAKEHGMKKILLCYDADISENDAVAKAALKFSHRLIKSGLDIEYMIWDSAYGKGVDDMINNGYQEALDTRPAVWYNQYVLEPMIRNQKSA